MYMYRINRTIKKGGVGTSGLSQPSNNQGTPVHFLIWDSAEWQPLDGLNPWEFVSNF